MPDSKKNSPADSRDEQKFHESGPKSGWAFFCRQDVQLFIFAAFFTALNWPFLTIANRSASVYSLLAYLFGVWMLIIVVLFLIGRSLRKGCPAQSPGDYDEGS